MCYMNETNNTLFVDNERYIVGDTLFCMTLWADGKVIEPVHNLHSQHSGFPVSRENLTVSAARIMWVKMRVTPEDKVLHEINVQVSIDNLNGHYPIDTVIEKNVTLTVEYDQHKALYNSIDEVNTAINKLADITPEHPGVGDTFWTVMYVDGKIPNIISRSDPKIKELRKDEVYPRSVTVVERIERLGDDGEIENLIRIRYGGVGDTVNYRTLPLDENIFGFLFESEHEVEEFIDDECLEPDNAHQFLKILDTIAAQVLGETYMRDFGDMDISEPSTWDIISDVIVDRLNNANKSATAWARFSYRVRQLEDGLREIGVLTISKACTDAFYGREGEPDWEGLLKAIIKKLSAE